MGGRGPADRLCGHSQVGGAMLRTGGRGGSKGPRCRGRREAMHALVLVLTLLVMSTRPEVLDVREGVGGVVAEGGADVGRVVPRLLRRRSPSP